MATAVLDRPVFPRLPDRDYTREEIALIEEQASTSLRAFRQSVRVLVVRTIRRYTPVRSGALRDSTRVTFRGDAIIIHQLFYGEFVNFGTRYIPARRYLERAMLSIAATLRRMINESGHTLYGAFAWNRIVWRSGV